MNIPAPEDDSFTPSFQSKPPAQVLAHILVRSAQSAPTQKEQEAFKTWQKQFWLRDPDRLISKAIKQGREDCLNILIAEGHGSYRLHKAAQSNDCKAIKMLLDAGADINEKDDDNDTPLIEAVLGNQFAATELLLQRGADINARGFKDQTALICGAVHHSAEICKLLLSYRPDPTIAGYAAGQKIHTALQCAKRRGNAPLIALLSNYEKEWEAKTKPISGPITTNTVQDHQSHDLPPGWSAIANDEVQMVIRTVCDEASNTTIKDIFDFNAGRLLTTVNTHDQNGAPQEKALQDIKPEFLARARDILHQARAAQHPNSAKEAKSAPPGYIMT